MNPDPAARLLALLTEQLADRYRIERELGRGSMSRVYLAHDLRHDRPVAVKLLPPELAIGTNPDRFLREVAFARDLVHPGIVPLIDSGSENGLCWYVMPVVAGETVRDRLRREGLPSIEDALRITIQAGEALAYAHGKGIVHRDLKPENIMIADGRAMVVDFGLARAIGSESNLTGTGMPLGTPTYMSPEQITGAAEAGVPADVYSFGCVVYEMLTGRPPFLGRNVVDLLKAHLSQQPEPPSRHRREIGPAIDAALLTALAKEPAGRQPGIERFLADLRAATPAPAPAPPPPAPPPQPAPESPGFLGRLFGRR